MFDKINFYDLYGYLIPGFVLISLIGLPFFWLSGVWPSVDLDSAVAVLILSYVIGFILQSVASNAISSKFRPARKERTGEARKRRYPSDYLLDDEDPGLSSTFRSELRKVVSDKFGLDIATAEGRRDAFLNCRAALVGRRIAAYSEQAQGMYALARGLLLAVGLTIPFFAGWGLALFRECLLGIHFWWILSPLTAAAIFVVGASSLKGHWVKAAIGISLLLVAMAVLLRAYVFIDARRRAIWIALPFFFPLCAALLARRWSYTARGRYTLAVAAGVTMLAVGFDCSQKSVPFEAAVRMFGAAIVGMLLGDIARCCGSRWAEKAAYLSG
jgi:hypothetical protein